MGFWAERRKELKAKKQTLAEELARKSRQPITEYSKLIELDDTIMSTLPDLDDIDARQPSELEHNRALEQGIVFQERIDRLLNSAHKRRNDALHLLDLCRHGLGQHGREISNQIIIAGSVGDYAAASNNRRRRPGHPDVGSGWRSIGAECPDVSPRCRALSPGYPDTTPGFRKSGQQRERNAIDGRNSGRECGSIARKCRDGAKRVSSARKASANRRNGRKGRGPRTETGKRRASRNALRHGFAATIHRQPMPQSHIDHFARTLCGDDHDPLLFEQALTIAENQVLLRLIEAQQLAVVERLWDPTETALVKGDNRTRLMRARVRKKQLAVELLVPLREALLEKYKNVLGENRLPSYCFIPCHLEAYLEEKASDLESEALKRPDLRFDSEFCMKPRDDLAAMQDAARDLMRLERYQRQAWSRLKKAIRRFINLKLNAVLIQAPAQTKSVALPLADNSD